MKKNLYKYMVLCLTALSGLSLFSCSSDEVYDVYGNPNNLVFLNVNSDNTLSGGVVHTPVGEFGGFDSKIPVFIQRPVGQTTVASLELDNSLLDAYNQKNETEYEALPEGYLNLGEAVAHIKADAQTSYDSLHIVFKEGADLSKLTAEGYVAPLRLHVEGKGTPSEERGVVYVVITTSTKLIHDNIGYDDMPGNEIPVADMASWTTDTGAEMWIVSDNNNWSCWNPNPDRVNSYVIDMQKEMKVGGVSGQIVYAAWGYTFNSIELSLSTDGKNWVDCGKANSSEMHRDGNGYQYLGLYGTVPARYLKVTFTMPNTWVGIGELRVFAE